MSYESNRGLSYSQEPSYNTIKQQPPCGTTKQQSSYDAGNAQVVPNNEDVVRNVNQDVIRDKPKMSYKVKMLYGVMS